MAFSFGDIKKSISSGVDSVGKGVSGFVSDASGVVSDAWNDVSDAASGLVGDLGRNLGGGKIGVGIGNNGKFSVNGTIGGPKEKALQASRPNSELKELYSAGKGITLQYPEDLDDSHYLLFNVNKRITKNDLINNPETTGIHIQTIVLPIPLNLNDSRSVNYNNANLGVLGGIGAGAVAGDAAFRDVTAAIKSFGGAGLQTSLEFDFDLVKGAGGELIQDPAGTIATAGAGYLGFKAAQKLGVGALGGAAAAVKFGQGLFFAQGKAFNPRMAVLFENVNFREFSFSYRLIARNSTESNQITNIVRAFQEYMMPRYAGETRSQFDYPFEFNLQFAKPLQKHLFDFQPCVLKAVNVSYNGDTGPAFFDDSDAPVIVDIQLQFQETRILTRETNVPEIHEETEIPSVETRLAP